MLHRLRSNFSYLTFTLILLNVAIFLYLNNSNHLASAIKDYSFKLTGNSVYYSWFTFMFLHSSWFHLTTSMVFLFVFGSFLESVLSRKKLFVLYVMGGIFAAFSQLTLTYLFPAISTKEFVVIGSTGAIFALISVVAIKFRQNKVTYYVVAPLFLFELTYLPTNSSEPASFIFVVLLFVLIFGIGFTRDLPILSLISAWPIFTTSVLFTASLFLIMQIGIGGLFIFQGSELGYQFWIQIGGLVGGIVAISFMGLTKDADDNYIIQDASNLMRQNKYSEAANKYLSIITVDKRDPDILRKAAIALALAGNTEESAKFFRESFLKYYSFGKKENAYSVYEDIQNIIPSFLFEPKFEIKLAAISLSKNNLNAAMTLFNKIINNYPDSQEAQLATLRVAQIFEIKGDYIRAREAFTIFAKKYPQSHWAISEKSAPSVKAL